MSRKPPLVYARTHDGARLAYQEVGAGPRDLVFVPGGSTSLEDWELPVLARAAEEIGAFARLVRFDHRGVGRSDPLPPLDRPTLEQRAEDLGSVIDAAGLDAPILFATHDGGPVALLFAATYPERVGGLILCNTWARLRVAEDQPFGLTDEVAEAMATGLGDIWGTGATLELLAPSAATDLDALDWWARSEQMTASPSAAVALFRLALDTDVRAMVPAVQAPTLVIHLRGNRFVEVAHGRNLAAAIEGARLAELEGDDHIFWFGPLSQLLSTIEEFITGAKRVSPGDRVVTTVLFTDIVGSTARAAELGDRAWRSLVDRHDQLVRQELAAHGGMEVDHAGDGFFATFDGPAQAIRCAGAIRSGLSNLGLEVRAGIHTGEVERRADRVTGMGVHIGARVSAQGGAGEILASRTVRDLVVGSRIEFGSKGSFNLKGVPDTWELFEVLVIPVD